MASITKSTSRLVWAMSLLGLDRLAAFFTSDSPWDQPDFGEVERTANAFNTLSDTVRDLVSPTFQSMLDTGDRILDRLFGRLDAFDAEQELPWPFPTGPYDNPDPNAPASFDHPSFDHPMSHDASAAASYPRDAPFATDPRASAPHPSSAAETQPAHAADFGDMGAPMSPVSTPPHHAPSSNPAGPSGRPRDDGPTLGPMPGPPDLLDTLGGDR